MSMSPVLRMASAAQAMRRGNQIAVQDLWKQGIVDWPDHDDYYAQAAVVEADVTRSIWLYQRAIYLDPKFPMAWNNLGLLFHVQGRYEGAVECYQRSIDLSPQNAAAFSNLGNAYQQLRRLGDAKDALEQALDLDSDFGDALNNLGNVLLDQGMASTAVDHFDQAAALGHRNGMFNAAFGRLYCCDDPDEIFEHSRRVVTDHLSPQQQYFHTKNDHPMPFLGFVSGDFRHHPVGLMTIATLEYLAKQGFDLTIYASSATQDHVTERFKRIARFVDVSAVNDAQLADLITGHEIDILFDLSGYTAGHRLGAFALKPAPIQISWFAYPGTTGMDQMDYIIAERVQFDGLEEVTTEQFLYLPSIVAFEPWDHKPVGPLPALENGYITFGSFNVLKKIGPLMVDLWAEILHAVEGSKMMIKAPALDCPQTRDTYELMFRSHGIDANRLIFLGYTDSAGHHDAMSKCDIALDTYPYSGGVTTLECLWSGLPVITMPGKTYASRHSAAYLTAIGCDDLICQDPMGYKNIARGLSDQSGWADLNQIRQDLRPLVQWSPICNVTAHGRALADHLMTLWSNYP